MLTLSFLRFNFVVLGSKTFLDEEPRLSPHQFVANRTTELACFHLFPATYGINYAKTWFQWAEFSSWDSKEVLYQHRWIAEFQCDHIMTARPDTPGDTWFMDCYDDELVTLENAPIDASKQMQDEELIIYHSTRAFCIPHARKAQVGLPPLGRHCVDLPPMLIASDRFAVLVYTAAHTDSHGYETARTGKLVETDIIFDVKHQELIDYASKKNQRLVQQTSVIEYYVPKNIRSRGFIACALSRSDFEVELTIAYIEIPKRKDGSG